LSDKGPSHGSPSEDNLTVSKSANYFSILSETAMFKKCYLFKEWLSCLKGRLKSRLYPEEGFVQDWIRTFASSNSSKKLGDI
jgi:hypothetical protein